MPTTLLRGEEMVSIKTEQLTSIKLKTVTHPPRLNS